MGGVCQTEMDMQNWNCRTLHHEQRMVADACEGNRAKSATETKAGVMKGLASNRIGFAIVSRMMPAQACFEKRTMTG